MREAASRLFALLNELDTQGIESIYAERVPIWAWEGDQRQAFRASYKAKLS
jgi:hypothetical protein